MPQIADQLAVAVGAQWEAEAAIRRLNDPYPLPVSWDPADPSLTDSWESLVRLASEGAGWPPPPPPGTWAAGPEDLAGTGGDLVKVLVRVPTGRLVVLGEPGAGKTMLMVRLVLDLLARRAEGGPLPILASIASWNPANKDLRAWLGEQLMTDHPALVAAPPTDRNEPTQAAALLASGLILPILDGLDEIPEGVRSQAISKISDALRPGERFVMTCRSQQYQDAIRPEGGVKVTLRGAVVQLRSLNADDVSGYLCDDPADPVAKARWDPVLKVLGTNAPAGQALRTPLMAALARAIYNPRPGELAGELHEPAELCKPYLADRAAVESVLFDAFIPSAYRQRIAPRWEAQDAQKWLIFLAGYLEHKIAGPDLAWWQLPRAARRTAFRLVVGLVVGLVAGLVAGLLVGLAVGLAVGPAAGLKGAVFAGIFAGIFAGRVAGRQDVNEPSRGMRVNAGPLAASFVVGLVAGLVAGLVVGLVGGHATGLAAGLVTGVATGLAVATGLGVQSARSNLAAAVSPQTLLARDRQAALRFMLVAGLVAGLGAGLAVGLATGLAVGLVAGLAVGLAAGLAAGLVIGLVLSMLKTAWPSYMLARGWLALRRELPWSLISFFEDAHQRGVLRQVGAVYQFRHIELQHRLATRPSNPPEVS